MLIYRAVNDAADSDDRVLDIGTKDGQYLSDHAETVAIDIRLVESRSTGHEYAMADGRQLPFADGAFDYIVCNQVLEHVNGKGCLLDEAARVLQPDGTFYVSIPNRMWPVDHHGFPFGVSLLPRAVGRRVTQFFGTRPAFYRDHMFNLSPIRARRLLHSRFETVAYTTPEHVRRYRDVYDDSRAGRLLQRLMPAMSACTSTRAGQWAFELSFPYTAYRCRL